MAVTLEELVVKLEAENKGFMTAMAQSQKATQQAMEGMAKAIEGMAAKSEKELTFFQTAMANMTGFLASNLVMGAFDMAKDAASALFNVLLVDGVKGAAEAQDAVNRLNASLGLAGSYSEDASNSFQKMANGIERTTGISADLVLQQSALARNFTQTNEEAEKLVGAAVDLAAATGIELETAVRQLGVSMTGTAGKLGQVVPGVNELTDAQLKSGAAIDLVTARYRGAGIAAVNSYSGQQKILGEAFDSVTEVLGENIVQNVALIDVMKFASAEMFGFSDSADESKQMIQEMIAEGIIYLIDTITVLTTALDAVSRIGTAAFRTLESAVLAVSFGIAKGLNLIGVTSDETVENLKSMMKETASSITDAFSEETGLESAAVKFAEMGDVADKALVKVRSGMLAIPEPINSTKVATTELSEAMKALIAEGTELSESYNKAAVSGKAMSEQLINDATLARDVKLMALEEERAAEEFNFQSTADRQAAELALQTEFMQAKRDANQLAMDAELEAIIAAAENEKITLEQKEIAIAGIKKKYGDISRKDDLEMAKFKKTLLDQEVADREAQIGVLAGLQTSQNSFAKGVGKAFAVANTIIKTQEGAQAAYAAMAGIPFVGPALGAAAAAAVIADGAARISTIRGAQTGITEVPGIGTRDTFGPVALAPGERVVPGETNQDLKKAISMILEGGGGGGGSVVEVHLSSKEGFMDWIETQIVQRRRLNTGLGV